MFSISALSFNLHLLHRIVVSPVDEALFVLELVVRPVNVGRAYASVVRSSRVFWRSYRAMPD